MSDPVKKVQIALRAESALFKAQLRRTVRSVALLLGALVFALLALTVFNYASFVALEEELGGVYAGLIVGGADLLIAALLINAALSEPKTTEEEKLAAEVRDMSYAALGEDVERARRELTRFTADVHRIRSVFALLTGGITAPLTFLIKALSGQMGQPEDTDDTDESAAAPGTL